MTPRRKTPLSSVKPEAYPLLGREGLGGLQRLWAVAEADRRVGPWLRLHDDFAMRLLGLLAQELPAWREITGRAAEALVARLLESTGGRDCPYLAHSLMMATMISGDEGYSCEQLIVRLREEHPGGLDVTGRLAARLHDRLYGTDYGPDCDEPSTPCAPHVERDLSCGKESVQQPGALFIVPALGLAPVDPGSAGRIYECLWQHHGVEHEDGCHLNRPLALTTPWVVDDWLANAGALACAHEFNDVDRLEGLRRWFEACYAPTYTDGEFHYTFGIGDSWRRDIANIWAAMAHVGEPGALRRLYNEPDMDRHAQPAVSGVDYPDVALRQAYYDPEKDTLVVGTTAGLGRVGSPTEFRVTNLAPGGKHEAIVDGVPSDCLVSAGPGEVTVHTTVGNHTFVIR